MNPKLFILLGCHINELLNGRIETAIGLAMAGGGVKTDWFLSGGIKNPREDTVSEAEKMAQKIHSHENKNVTDWNFIYDTTATNTAENFIMADRELNLTTYSEIYVVTSKFHHNRAKAIADKVIHLNNFKWALSDLKLKDSDYWEKIHIKNVDSDVRNAFARLHNHAM